MVPELVIPPEKVEIVTDPPEAALPPTQMALPCAEMVPELVMLPEKVNKLTDAPVPLAVPP